MRKTLGIGFAVMLILGTFSLSASSQPRCTIRGSMEGDFLNGTKYDDRICGRGGNDFVSGQEGRDIVRGGPNNDTVVGGKGADRIFGRGGNDKLFGIDGHGDDVLRGGVGQDQCFGEKHDRYRGCERKVTNSSPHYPLAAVMAMSRAYERLLGKSSQRLCLLDPILCFESQP